MKKLAGIIFVFLLVNQFAAASSFNPAVYRAVQASSYRHNYRNNVNNQPMPYWQAQANFTTRNKVYQNYTQYENARNQYNNSHLNYRGYR